MFRQIPLRAMRLLLAITYLRVALVTALPIEGSGSDLSPRSPDSESRPEILDITVVYCNPHYEPDPPKNGQGRFLKLINVKEIRLAEIKAREKSEGRGKEEKVEGEKSERGMKKLKERQRTNYADVSPALCLGMKACYFYQKDSNGDPKIGNLAPYIHKARFSLSNEKPSFQISYLYHKSMLVSLILNGPQSEISKEDLFDTFSTFEKLQSALNKQKIHVTISDDNSLLSAMLQFMDRMKVLRGYYDKDQTLEQNMASKGKPVWATLKFLSPSNNLQTSPDIRSQLTSIELLQDSRELKIVDDDSLIRAILIHLQKNHWLSLTDEELKINLAKPLENLIYRGRDNSQANLGPSASSLTSKRPSSPVSSLDMTAPGQSGPSESRPLPDPKKLKSDVGMVSSHQPDTGLAASHESGPPRSSQSKRPSGHWFDTVLD
ncbi:hypothetical protein EV360DRAFT_72048 [Lentinula raphanica]|nr:hypothetical protein EV360DRAFT_72048 [Lentinula raphanica]